MAYSKFGLAMVGLTVVGGGVMACSGATPPQAEVVSVDRTAGPPTTLSFEGAAPSEVLVAVEQLTGEPVVVEATALTSLGCLKVTVKERGALPPRAAAARLFDALRGQGLRVQHGKGGWVVGLDASRPPAVCAPPRAIAAALADAPDVDAGGGGAGVADEAPAVAEALASIREISPTEHAITRRGINILLEHQGALMRSARVVPEQVGGVVVGVRLFGIRPGTVLGKLGFENGDRIERVQGKSIASPEHALELYVALRGARTIECDVTRRGVAQRLLVHVE